MLPILVKRISAKRIATQMLIIAKLKEENILF